MEIKYYDDGRVKSIEGVKPWESRNFHKCEDNDNAIFYRDGWNSRNYVLNIDNPNLSVMYRICWDCFSSSKLCVNPFTKQFVNVSDRGNEPRVMLTIKLDDNIRDVSVFEDWLTDDCVRNSAVINENYYILKSLAVDIGNNHWVRKNEANNYAICNGCGKVYNKRYDRLSDSRERNLCFVCEGDDEARVLNYHSHKKLGKDLFFNDDTTTNDASNFAGYGIELETELCSGYSEDKENIKSAKNIMGEHIYYERDGSLCNGFEHITRPHTYKAMLDLPWEKYLNRLRECNYKSHIGGHCGMHIHASRTLFGKTEEEQENNIAKLICFFAMYESDLKKFSRRASYNWCNFNGYSEDKNNCERYVKNKGDFERYSAINLCNKNTVEFRLARGTLKYETFIATFKFTAHLVDKCVSLDWDAVADYNNWLEGLDDDTLAYLKSRHCFNLSESTTRPRAVGEV